ncbi:fluoride efflux transporter CrcB [Bacillus sp. NPDC077027]|uniref:fluoride efflux transporter CrcB n=1 Tax=Bacillus sp. NPDC077027 TaxID=3390548 RepID=UPI003D0526C8
MIVIYMAIAGGAGSVLRLFLSRLFQSKMASDSFPYGIILVNLIGAIGLGVLTGALDIHSQLVVIIGTGFFGGFTTFSTFSVETATLLSERKIAAATAYLLMTVLGSIILFVAGFQLGRLFH